MNTAAGRKVISGYGNGGFRISDIRHEGSVIVFPETVVSWPVSAMDEVTPVSLDDVVVEASRVDILLVGCGNDSALVPKEVRDLMRQHGIVIDAMTTGAACRTYNILLSEARQVAAALIAV